jgi:hypothetical protein
MFGVVEGFVTIGAVIAVGFLLAHLGILGESSQPVLARVAFYVASPALMIGVLGRTDLRAIFSSNLIASVASVVIVALLWILAARLWWHRSASDTAIGTFCAAYVNAGNLGLPIAGYVLGDASLVAPMLLTQLIVLQPLGLAVLDATTGVGKVSVLSALLRPVRTPLTVGSLIGVAISAFDLRLPELISAPLDLLGGLAIPAMLIAYGVSLRLGPRPGSGESPVQLTLLITLKTVVQPLCAYLVARFLLDLEGPAVFAVTLIAALPTAQNVFTHAVRYDRGVLLARDCIFATTLLSVPAIVLIAALLS